MTKPITLQSQTHLKTHSLSENKGFSIQVANKMEDIKEAWSATAPQDNLFLQSTYLGMLEKFPPEKMSFRYVVFYQDNQAVGVAYHQVFKLNIEDSINKQEEEETNGYCIITALRKAVKKWFIKRAEFNLLICGNLLLTGEYGFHFNTNIQTQQAAQLVQEGMSTLQNLLDAEQTKVSVHLVKDYKIETAAPLEAELKNNTFHPFKMQPSMTMHIPEEWKSFDDYIEAMSSKYRVRARRARKKGSAIVRKELTLNEMEENEARIYTLYKSIADGAGFNAFLLHPQYFTALKRSLGDNYKLTAYYIDGELVAFYTAIFNHHEMDAHFLGVDAQYNREHQVYLNILYDLVNTAIEHGSTHIDFARTALEIKSSVGAVAQDMLCFFRHRSTLSSKFLQLVFDQLNPKEEWQPRSPFKNTVPANN